MKRAVLIAVLSLALTALLLAAMQCDGGAAPVPTLPAATTAPGVSATQPAAQPTTPPDSSAYPAGTGEPTQPVATEGPSPYPPASAPPDAEKLLSERCTGCHDLERVTSAKKNEAEWRTTVDRMIGKGAKLTTEEADVLVRFLSKVYQ